MINIKSPINKSTLYSDKVYIEYTVQENSKFTEKVVFIVDGVKYEKTELNGSFFIQNVTEGKHLLRAYLVNKSNKIIVGSENKVTFQTNTDLIFIKNKLSNVVSSQIPSFIREDYNNFVLFIEKYYEYLEQTNEPNKVPFSQGLFSDVDHTPQILLDKFKKLFIPDFPDELTKDKQTGNPLNLRTLIKRAIEFYQTKGTEKSFSFLFRILFDTEIEIFYPRTEMLIVSGGLWKEKKSIKILAREPDKIRALIGKLIYQKNDQNQKVNTARVVSCDVYVQSPYKIAELELTEINGTIVNGRIYCDLIYEDAEQTFSFELKRGISDIEFSSQGNGYSIGDTIRLISTGGSGVGYIGRIIEIGNSGQILKTETINFGVNYEENVQGLYSVQITTVSGNGAIGQADSTLLCEYDGYYKNSKSVLGAKNFLQDNYYYQTHSYEIKSDVPLEKYKDVVDRIVHPSGYKLFGKLVVKPRILFNPTTLNNLSLLTSNFIGNYLPYRLSSVVNLRDEDSDLFPNGFNPEQAITPQTGVGEFIHDSLDNPINQSVTRAYYSNDRVLPDVSDIYYKNQYWVVFPHPATDLNTNETIESFLDLTIANMAIYQNNVIIGDNF